MENKQIKTIAVLTSGGDSPGMNAAIRAVVRTAISRDIDVIGVRHGYTGLINDDTFPMNVRSVSEIIQRGGTILHTSRCEEFMHLSGQLKAKKTCEENGIDAVVVIGGDGSYRGALALSKAGVSCVGLPGTIDNDIGCTDETIGYDTAMNTVVDMVDKLRDTAQSHDRCSVVEVMGRHAGFLALNTGLACGALTTLVPEIPFDIERDVVSKMFATQRSGKKHFIIVVAEGCGDIAGIAKEIQRISGVETRATILGHVQRGGTPTLRDRVLASRMGFHAVDILSRGITNRIVAIHNEKIVDIDIEEALQMTKTIDMTLIDVSNAISL